MPIVRVRISWLLSLLLLSVLLLSGGLAGTGMVVTGLADTGLAVAGLAGPGLAGPGLAGSGLAGPGLAGPGLAGPALAGPALAGTVATQPAPGARAPDRFRVRLHTTKGVIVIDVHREWAPIGTDRFHELVVAGYYDDVAFTRVIAGRWVQFGINGDPKIANAWRARTIADDPFKEANVRGTVAFAFAVPNGRTTQVFINLADNRATHDREPFVPFGRVISGMDVVDALYSGYAEAAGSGIRSGKQGPLFEGGNAYLRKEFPKLDYIRRATIETTGETIRK